MCRKSPQQSALGSASLFDYSKVIWQPVLPASTFWAERVCKPLWASSTASSSTAITQIVYTDFTMVTVLFKCSCGCWLWRLSSALEPSVTLLGFASLKGHKDGNVSQSTVWWNGQSIHLTLHHSFQREVPIDLLPYVWLARHRAIGRPTDPGWIFCWIKLAFPMDVPWPCF